MPPASGSPISVTRGPRPSRRRCFQRLRDEGVIAPGTRLPVALPTPTAVIGTFFSGDDRRAIEPVYRDLVFRELRGMLAAVPHDDLAIQWDCAVEFAIIETHAYPGGSTPWWEGDVWQGLVARAPDAIDQVPADVEVGVHLCYGDVGEKHFIEPRDAANLTRFANELVDAAHRPVTWIHLPVPIERDDDAYFAPLEELEIGDAELYLGLVHREDGVDGASRRIEAAARHVDAFGVATECGIGRAPKDATEDIFRSHVAVAQPV